MRIKKLQQSSSDQFYKTSQPVVLDEIDVDLAGQTLQEFARQQREQIISAKERIERMKKEIQSFDIVRIADAESRYFEMKREATRLKEEKQTLSKEYELASIEPDQQQASRAKQIKEREHELQSRVRNLKQSIRQKEKKLALLHKAVVDRQDELKLVESRNRELNKSKQFQNIGVGLLLSKIKQLEGDEARTITQVVPKERKRVVQMLRQEVEELESTLDKKVIYLREREREHKANQQRFKELIMLSMQKGGGLSQASVCKKQLLKLREDPDIKQFLTRHKSKIAANSD